MTSVYLRNISQKAVSEGNRASQTELKPTECAVELTWIQQVELLALLTNKGFVCVYRSNRVQTEQQQATAGRR